MAGNSVAVEEAERRVELLKTLAELLDEMTLALLHITNCTRASKDEIAVLVRNYVTSLDDILRTVNWSLPLMTSWIKSCPTGFVPQEVENEIRVQLLIAKSLVKPLPTVTQSKPSRPKKGRRSKEESDAEALIISALVQHHITEDGFQQSPLSPTELGGKIGRDKGTVSRFYTKHFQSYRNWCLICSRLEDLKRSLKKLDPSCLNC